jgi:hypothetical protein
MGWNGPAGIVLAGGKGFGPVHPCRHEVIDVAGMLRRRAWAAEKNPGGGSRGFRGTIDFGRTSIVN